MLSKIYQQYLSAISLCSKLFKRLYYNSEPCVGRAVCSPSRGRRTFLDEDCRGSRNV